MRLSGERYVRLRVVLLSVPAAESRCCRSAIGRAPRAPREVPDDELVDVAGSSQGEAGCSGLSVLPAPRRHSRPSPRGVRLAHSPRSPESVHLVPNLVDREILHLRRSFILTSSFSLSAQGFLWQRLQGFKTHLIRSSASPTRTDPLVAMH